MKGIVVLFSVFGFSIGLGHTDASSNSEQVKTNLTVNLYYESLCPDCQVFSKLQLCPAWEKLGNYFRIEFVPYGNAETKKNETGEITISCQHGPRECVGNRIQSCALKHLSYSQSTKFICCMESAKTFETAGEDCAGKLGIEYEPIATCAKGPEGNQLHYLNGVKTDGLVPKHEWVPWILFNGQYNRQDMDHAQEDLVSVLCKYMQDPKASQCNEIF